MLAVQKAHCSPHCIKYLIANHAGNLCIADSFLFLHSVLQNIHFMKLTNICAVVPLIWSFISSKV